LECAIADRLEVFVADDALEGGASDERQLFNDFEFIGQGDTRELGALLESPPADSLEAFVADDALEGGAVVESQILDDCELIWESDTREGVAKIKCVCS